MSTKETGFLRGITKGFNRGWHTVKAKVGKAEETKDSEFERDKELFNKMLADVGGLAKDIKIHRGLLLSLSTSYRDLMQRASVLLPEGDTVGWKRYFTENLGETSLVSGLELARSEAEQVFKAEVSEPLDVYLAQFEEIKRRIDERNRRRVDYDRYGEMVAKWKSKPSKNVAKMEETNRKHTEAKFGYESINEELKRDISLLHKDYKIFLQPLIVSLFFGLITYHSTANNTLSPLKTMLETADRRSHIGRAGWVITPSDSSFAYKPVYSKAQTQTTPTTAQITPTTFPTSPPPPPPTPIPRPFLARALYSFEGPNPGELSFKAGDILQILDNTHGREWWEAENQGKRGLVPSNFLQPLS